jgi:hypothetical protein
MPIPPVFLVPPELCFGFKLGRSRRQQFTGNGNRIAGRQHHRGFERGCGHVHFTGYLSAELRRDRLRIAVNVNRIARLQGNLCARVPLGVAMFAPG